MHYNRIAGTNLERLAALSDGIFGVAMTLLVLGLSTPAANLIHSDGELWHGLVHLTPALVTYVMSFLTAGIFWVGQQTQFNYMSRSDRHFSWMQIGFLFCVSMLPFSTSLLSAFIAYRLALLVYWFNIFLLASVLYASSQYAKRSGLIKTGTSMEAWYALEKRILVAECLYGIGALLCIFSTYLSIALIVLVQLNYATALPFPWNRSAARTDIDEKITNSPGED